MLTKQDLNAIGSLIEIKLEEKLESKFDKKLAPIQKGIQNLQNDTIAIKVDVATVKLEVKKLRQDLNGTINFFDNADKDTRNNLNKTRKDLGLNEVEFAY